MHGFGPIDPGKDLPQNHKRISENNLTGGFHRQISYIFCKCILKFSLVIIKPFFYFSSSPSVGYAALPRGLFVRTQVLKRSSCSLRATPLSRWCPVPRIFPSRGKTRMQYKQTGAVRAVAVLLGRMPSQSSAAHQGLRLHGPHVLSFHPSLGPCSTSVL